MHTIDTEALTELIQHHALHDDEACIDASVALEPSLAGVRIFDEPLVGFADAANPAFAHMHDPEVVGELAMLPEEFLPGAKSVISIFFPFSKTVRESNYGAPDEIGNAWLHGRIEGQAYLKFVERTIVAWVAEHGGRAIAPMTDERNKVEFNFDGHLSGREAQSCWSERHVAWIAGLGTFCLTRGLITRRGVAGRFCSIITTLPIDRASEQPYEGVYDWCIRCGKCIDRCPAKAITLEHGKNQDICHDYLEAAKLRYAPRYGCGKCQTLVACEACAPGLRGAVS